MKRQWLYLMVMTILVFSGCEKENAENTASKYENTNSEAAENIIEDSIGTEETEAETVVDKTQLIQEILDSLQFNFEPVKLTDVTELLEEKGIFYEGYYNQSGERVDLVLEDGTKLIFLETRDPDMNPIGYELIMKGNEINYSGFQENYLNAYDVIWEDYYYPEISERLWTENEIWGMNQTDLSIMRNEIFAKYGRQFEDPFLNAVFSLKKWYEPKYSAEEFNAMQLELLTDIEKQNLQMILEYEVNTGYRKKSTDNSKKLKKLLSGSFIDLDHDGQKEQIFYQTEEADKTSDWQEITKANICIKETGSGEKASFENQMLHEGISLYEECYLGSMDGETYFLVVGDSGFSDDYMLTFYQYDEGELKKIGEMYTAPKNLEIYEDKITAPEETNHFQCQPVRFTYILKEGSFVKQEEDYYDYRQNIAVAKQEVPLYAARGENETGITIAAGEEVQVMGGDMKVWVLLRNVSTGEEGWLKVEENVMCQLPDGDVYYSDQLFEGLYFYG